MLAPMGTSSINTQKRTVPEGWWKNAGCAMDSPRWVDVLLGAALAARRCAPLEMAERDAPLAQVVGRQLERYVVAGQDADVVLAHLAAGVGHQLVAVFQRHAATQIGQDLVDDAAHFDQFFLCHRVRPGRCSTPAGPSGLALLRTSRAGFRSAPWSRRPGSG